MASSLRDELQSVLGTSYSLERELTGGGMSRVFVAEEARLGRKVAVKVLPPEIAGDISTERFTREIQLLARLQHPHIVPILTAGEARGILYYTMPLIAGESLRDRLARDGRLGLDEAIRLATEVADALTYAHAHDVLHRDIKPENIIISGRHALLVDFGIAKAIDASKVSGHLATLTQEGLAIGTPQYMSPEQALGDPTLDARSDVYSLAAVLFEALTGRVPFVGTNAAAVIAKRFVEPPPRLDAVDATMDATVSDAVARAMAVAAEHRFPSASEFASALTVAVSRPGATRAPDAFTTATRRSTAPARSIVVLPFTNGSADAESEYFSDGMTEEIISALARLPGVRVTARTSSFSLKGKEIDIARVAEKFNVATVLEGSVRRAGGRIRVTARLIDAAEGYQIWSERYDRNYEDVFEIQDDIARAIAGQLEVQLAGSGDQALVRPATDDVQAYDLYLKGRHLWRRRGPSLPSALEYFERAIAADPEFAAPHAGLADCYVLMAVYGYQPAADVFERARAAAYRALALAPHSAEAHTAVGLFELWMGWDFEIARRELQRAAEANPSWAVPVHWLGQLAVALGRYDEACTFAERARQIEPLSPLTAFVVAGVHVWSGNYTLGAEAARRAVEIDPYFPTGYLAAGWVQQHAGRHDEAIASFRRFADLSGRSSLALAPLGVALVDAGRFDAARAIVTELEARGADAWPLGQLYWKLGDDARAFDTLERAVRQRNACFFLLARSPGLEGLAADARWTALLRRGGLAPVANGFEAARVSSPNAAA